MPTTRTRHAGLLGTVVEIVAGGSAAAQDAARAAVLREVERLQQVFSVFDPTSALRRWQGGTAAATGELAEVVALAERWRRRSGGAFDPSATLLTEVWDHAVAAGRPPHPEELAAAIAAVRAQPRPRGHAPAAPASPYGLNAIAKGWIVDRAVAVSWGAADLVSLVVDAGGDLVHRGPTPVVVGIEDPHRPHDNARPLRRVQLHGAAIATSGSARRGWRVGERWYSHVLDPRTGAPVDHHASVSVVAPDAATADVVATVATVLPTDEALGFVDGVEHVAGCIVTADRRVVASAGWTALEVRPGP